MGCSTVKQLADQLGLKEGINVDIGTDLHGAGVSIKVTPFKKGMTCIQHKHAYAHLSVLLSGRVILKTDAYAVTLDASDKPVSVVIEANMLHQVTALTDAVWLCVNREVA
jgi:quercetin dioxygenase-like cupin family protein